MFLGTRRPASRSSPPDQGVGSKVPIRNPATAATPAASTPEPPDPRRLIRNTTASTAPEASTSTALAEEFSDTARQAVFQHPRDPGPWRSPSSSPRRPTILSARTPTTGSKSPRCKRFPAAAIHYPQQVFAASLAQTQGYDVDKPRNLAKSVT